jgi:hypothetical protein
MRCNPCNGVGWVLGGGMITRIDCNYCNGKGTIPKEYSTAIDKIKSADSSLTDREARKIFNEELDRIDKDDKRKKKKRIKEYANG